MAEPAAKPAADPKPDTKPKPDTADAEKIRADAEAAAARGFAAQLKEVTGVDSLEALAARNKQVADDKLKKDGKLQELVDVKTAEAADYKTKYGEALIQSAILGAAGAAVDPGTVHTLLAGAAAAGDDGTVTINGKTPQEAVADLLKEKPFLAKAEGKQGSGSGAGGGCEAPSWKDLEALKQSDPAAYKKALAERMNGSN